MEAATVQKRKPSVKKGKLKKAIRNVICRPDASLWPLISDNQTNLLRSALEKHKVNIPEFKKLQWKDLKLIPKDQRPKRPKIRNVEGLIFGINRCYNAVQSSKCSAIILESTLNPRMIVQPVLESCTAQNVPLVCLEGLRKLCLTNFGISTSCLGIKYDCLQDISSIVVKCREKENINKDTCTVETQKENDSLQVLEKVNEKENINKDTSTVETQKENDSLQVIEEVNENIFDSTNKDIFDSTINNELKSQSVYLYRNNKNMRAFDPSVVSTIDFIKLESKEELCQPEPINSFMKMILKKVCNNENRKRKSVSHL